LIKKVSMATYVEIGYLIIRWPRPYSIFPVEAKVESEGSAEAY